MNNFCQSHPRNLIIILYFVFSSVTIVTNAKDWVYTVRSDDNLWNLTKKHLLDTSYLKPAQSLNHIDNPWHVLPGTQLTLTASLSLLANPSSCRPHYAGLYWRLLLLPLLALIAI